MRHKILILAFVISFLSFATLVGCLSLSKNMPVLFIDKIKEERQDRKKLAWKDLEIKVRQEYRRFSGRAGVIIKDLETGSRISINPEMSFPSASLVKIPILVSCFQAALEGKIDINGKVVLRNKDKAPGSGSLENLPAGTEIKIGTLLELMITQSDNTASNMLIDLLSFEYLNDCFKRIGLLNTNIVRAMMDFKGRRSGRENFSTVSDVALILERIYQGKVINPDVSSRCLDILKKQKMRDRIPKNLPADTMVAHKTGLENGVCHDAGIVFTPGGDFLICVLTRHKDKTARKAKNFIARIAQEVYDYEMM